MVDVDETNTANKLSGKLKRVLRPWNVSRLNSDVFWYCAQSTPPPRNYTPGLIALLKRSLLWSNASGYTRRAALCYEGSVHISQERFDTGWGCGYRNFMMACAALMHQSTQPMYLPLLDASIPPGVRSLQHSIENAWKDGFDRAGAQDLKKLLGTRKWIGTADLWVAFTHRGIPATLVDFNLKNHPSGSQIVLDWIVEYFTSKQTSWNVNDDLLGASPVVMTDRMPIILQYDGHSRTIVGYEVTGRGKLNLLTFDPSQPVPEKTRQAAISLNTGSCVRFTGPDPGSTTPRNHLPDDEAPATSATSAGIKQTSCKPPMDVDIDDEAEILFAGEAYRKRRPNFFFQNAQKPDSGVGELSRILPHFRLRPTKLRKKEYQILYFPMGPPLTEAQKIERKVVTSVKVC